MGFALGPEAIAAGYGLRAFDSTGSTNAEALAAFRGGERGPLWFVTDRQTAGRGRRGRPWASPEGNLATSLLLVPDCPPSMTATLGFVAGIALDRAMRETAPGIESAPALDAADGSSAAGGARLHLKWPNDVVADGGKLAGILLEGEAAPDGKVAVVVGIGVNVVAAPDGLPYPATSLKELGSAADAAELFEALARHWVEVIGIWDRGNGFAAIRDLWLARAAGIGAPVAVQLGTEIERGTFETLDAGGRLVIRRPDGSSATITAGDVHFGIAATRRAG